MQEEGESKNDKWITGPGNGKTKHLLNPKPKSKLHNAFAILSQPGTPTYYNTPSPAQQMDNKRTIIPRSLQEHRRQQKKFQCQHIKQTLRRLRKSEDLFLDNSTTYAKEEHTAIAKGDTNSAECVAIFFCPCTMQPTNHRAHSTRPQYGLPLGLCLRFNHKKAQQEQTCQLCQAEQGTPI